MSSSCLSHPSYQMLEPQVCTTTHIFHPWVQYSHYVSRHAGGDLRRPPWVPQFMLLEGYTSLRLVFGLPLALISRDARLWNTSQSKGPISHCTCPRLLAGKHIGALSQLLPEALAFASIPMHL